LGNAIYSLEGNDSRCPLTCVIGAVCADGCAIISDTRVMREFEATNESKIHLLGKKAVLVGAGTGTLIDKLADRISESTIPSSPNLNAVVESVENIVISMRERYGPVLSNNYNFQALVMGLQEFDTGDPYLRLIHGVGISERVIDFAIIGHGAPYVASLFRLLYDRMLTATETAVLGYFCISSIVALNRSDCRNHPVRSRSNNTQN
jgi:20S proteasome alpha/beta subunit